MTFIAWTKITEAFFKIKKNFHRRKKVIQFWNKMTVNKWWQNFHCRVNYAFKCYTFHRCKIEVWNIKRILLKQMHLDAATVPWLLNCLCFWLCSLGCVMKGQRFIHTNLSSWCTDLTSPSFSLPHGFSHSFSPSVWCYSASAVRSERERVLHFAWLKRGRKESAVLPSSSRKIMRKYQSFCFSSIF